MTDPIKPYRFFLKLYPARFREEYGTVLEQQFRDEYRQARGLWGRFCFWMLALTDLLTSVPAELLHELKLDLVFAARVYRHRALSTLLALSALALAIGAATGIFSVVNAVLLRSLPFHEAERLVELKNSPLNMFTIPSHAALYDWRTRNNLFQDIAFDSPNEMNLSTAHGSMRIKAAETTANFFTLLGSEPRFGRGFAADEDIAGRDAVAIIGYGLWQRFFGSDPQILGASIRVNGTPLTVIGVAPQGFDYPGKVALWTPTVFDRDLLPKEGVTFWNNIGRLNTDVTLAQAIGFIQAEQSRIRGGPMPGEQERAKLIPVRDILAGDVRKASLVLMGVIIFVLLIACANVAHLLLSRTTERRQELTLRTALGASRARLVQQLITESMLLTVTASAAGLAVAHWVAKLFSTVLPAQLSAQEYTILDLRVFGFAVAAALLTGVVFGVLPVGLINRMQPRADVLRSQTGSSGLGVNRMRSILVAMQAALTVMLISGAAAMGHSFLKLANTDLGFRTNNIVTLRASLSGTSHEKGPSRSQYYSDVLDRLRAVPGVESAGAVNYLPLVNDPLMLFRFKLDAGPEVGAVVNYATPDYFRTLDTPVIAGREFTAADQSEAAPAIIVNEAFARQTGEASNLIGKKLQMPRVGGPRTIVGVVGTARISGPAWDGSPQIFWPIGKRTPTSITFAAKVRGDVQASLPACRTSVQTIDRQVPIYDVMTLDARLQGIMAKPRFYTTAIFFLGGFALLLAIVGIFGVASHSITQRTHEIGVRLAIGASPQDLRGMLLRQSITPVAVGMIAGVAGAFALGRFLQSLIDNAESMGILMCGIAAIVMAATAAMAVWTATNRIFRIDIMNVLRAE